MKDRFRILNIYLFINGKLRTGSYILRRISKISTFKRPNNFYKRNNGTKKNSIKFFLFPKFVESHSTVHLYRVQLHMYKLVHRQARVERDQNYQVSLSMQYSKRLVEQFHFRYALFLYHIFSRFDSIV